MDFRSARRWRHVYSLFAILAVVLLVAAACSASSDDDAAMQAARDGGAPGGASDTDGEAEESAAREAEAGDTAAAPGAASAGGENASEQPSNQTSLDRLVIRKAHITLTVDDVNQATAWVRELANRRQGFVLSSTTYVQDESNFAELTIRVPADVFDATMNELRQAPFVEDVVREESSSEDVSEEYVDNESRLEALHETQERYLALLSEADTIDEILRIEQELNDIRSQIETITGRQQYLDEMTSMSTITVSLHPPGETDDTPDDTFIASIFDDAWDQARGAIEGILTLTITLGIVALAALPLAAVALIVYRVARPRLRQS